MIFPEERKDGGHFGVLKYMDSISIMFIEAGCVQDWEGVHEMRRTLNVNSSKL